MSAMVTTSHVLSRSAGATALVSQRPLHRPNESAASSSGNTAARTAAIAFQTVGSCIEAVPGVISLSLGDDIASTKCADQVDRWRAAVYGVWSKMSRLCVI